MATLKEFHIVNNKMWLKNKKGTYCCVFKAALSVFLNTYDSTINTECTAAFPWQQWLCKCTTMIHFTYIAYPVVFSLCPALNFFTNFLLLCILLFCMVLLTKDFFTELLATFFFLYAYCEPTPVAMWSKP
jgi:hypothetical protein